MMLAVSVCRIVAAPVQNNSEKAIVIRLENGTLTLEPLNKNAVRVRFTQVASKPAEEMIYTEKRAVPKCKVKENDKNLSLSLEELTVEFDKQSQTLQFKGRKGNVLLREKTGGRTLLKSEIQGEPTYTVGQQFVSPPDEYLYGTGQFQDGYLNIRGLTRRLTQVNSQISIPFVLSNKGYGLLWNNYGLTDFNPADKQAVLIPALASDEAITVDATSTSGNRREIRRINSFTGVIEVPETSSYSLLLDVGQQMARKHYLSIDGKNVIDVNNTWLPPTTSVIVELTAGKHEIEVQGERNDKPVLYWREITNETTFRSPVAQSLDYTVFAGDGDEVIASYRSLTGASPMMPLWSLGYIHCRERYNTQNELIENAREFRQKKIPIDVIVQDWQYWGKYGWNAMQFDETRYPAPAAMTDELHNMNMRLMLSVWAKIDKQSEAGKQMAEKGYYIAGTDWIDFFNPAAAKLYWDNFSRRLTTLKIDAWWQDATEPENDDLQNRRVNDGTIPGEVYRNIYPLMVNKTVYEGLRRDVPEKRAMILTRCGFSGIQRYAVATWSGDVGNDWETLRRQIAGGLGQMATGVPWWTYDAGGFFRPRDQYENTEYHERFLRWLQAATFLPLMRVHGYMSNTEPWRYGDDVQRISTQYINMRYRLLPYIYSQAAAVSFAGSTLMRPLVMDFPTDIKALEQKGEYMFGKSFLVAPVTEAQVKQWAVYFPKESDWYDFWTNERFSGGQSIQRDAPIDMIPLFVKAGSIIPFGPDVQYATEKKWDHLELRVYTGANGSFILYEDEFDNYNYESGAYTEISIEWNETARKLTFGARKGAYNGMLKDRKFTIVLQDGTKKTVQYDGKKIDVKFGIWSHWGPQAVPKQGDWYARGMYERDTYDCEKERYNKANRYYTYHVANYGHPSGALPSFNTIVFEVNL